MNTNEMNLGLIENGRKNKDKINLQFNKNKMLYRIVKEKIKKDLKRKILKELKINELKKRFSTIK